MIRTFTDRMEMTIENYLYKKDDKELDVYLEVSYEVEGSVERSTHYGPWGEDTPDCDELSVLQVSVDFYEVYSEDGEPCDIILSPDDLRKIENTLYEKAEQHYYNYGDWGE